jgi:hypothetical protein
MNNLAFLSFVLVVLIVVSTINSYRMWHGQQGWVPRPTSPEYRMTFQHQRYMTANAISPLVWWAFGLISLGRYGQRKSAKGALHLLLYLPLWGGWTILVFTLVVGLIVFTSGRPIWIVPGQFRDAARRGWVRSSSLQ